MTKPIQAAWLVMQYTAALSMHTVGHFFSPLIGGFTFRRPAGAAAAVAAEAIYPVKSLHIVATQNKPYLGRIGRQKLEQYIDIFELEDKMM